MSELVHLDVADGVATITLDSEHNRNALSRQLVTELREHLASAEGDPEAKVVVIRSAHRVFCSGADLSEASSGSMEEGTRAIVDLQRRIVTSVKPVVVVLGVLAMTVVAGVRPVYVVVGYAYALVLFARGLDLLGVDPIPVIAYTTTVASLFALVVTLVRRVRASGNGRGNVPALTSSSN